MKVVETYRKDSIDQQQQISLLATGFQNQLKHINLLKEINADQDKVIKKFGQPKKWGIGPYVGYGLTGAANLGVSVGVSIQYSFIRF